MAGSYSSCESGHLYSRVPVVWYVTFDQVRPWSLNCFTQYTNYFVGAKYVEVLDAEKANEKSQNTLIQFSIQTSLFFFLLF